METKATRLEKLKKLVPVPEFIRISKGSPVNLHTIPEWGMYIIRGVSTIEDQKDSSHAGQFVTIGPVERSFILDAIERIFTYDWSCEVIVQKYQVGISGVAFCFSRDFLYIEYSDYKEGVTSGKIRPFVSILPTKKIEKYHKLQDNLQKIYETFGPSDVEFIDINNPTFVQVRPITRTFEVDIEMITLQMLLQESLVGKWIENDLAQVIGEHKKNDNAFAFYYIKTLTFITKRYFKRDIQISMDDVINIGEQYFISTQFIDATRLRYLDILRFAFVFTKKQQCMRDTEADVSLEELFEKSIFSSMAYTIFKKKEFFDIREKYRQKIDRLLLKEDSSDAKIRRFPYSDFLGSVIEIDCDTSTWITIQKRNSQGIQVVPGELDPKHFFLYQEGVAIPKGAVVVCDHLYPDIGKSIDMIAGILCANGSFNSHVAILCREKNVPLVIQSDREMQLMNG